jgi:hypothetical protein
MLCIRGYLLRTFAQKSRNQKVALRGCESVRGCRVQSTPLDQLPDRTQALMADMAAKRTIRGVIFGANQFSLSFALLVIPTGYPP